MNARHITHIREALWKRPERGACVMVGAGLSRQAEPGHPTATRPPSWKALRFAREWYAASSADGDTE